MGFSFFSGYSGSCCIAKGKYESMILSVKTCKWGLQVSAMMPSLCTAREPSQFCAWLRIYSTK